MDKKINLTQLANFLAQAGGMSKSASEQFVKNFFEIISQNVLSEGLVKVKGLGTFKLLQMEDRESVNVNTGERFTIEGHQKISFTPDTELKEGINKPFAAFETVEITSEQADTLVSMNTVSLLEEESDESSDVAEPTVKDITQKKGVRILLKLMIWILAVILLVPLVLYLFGPLIDNSVHEFLEREIKFRHKTEIVTDTTGNVPQTVNDEVVPGYIPSIPLKEAQEKPSAKSEPAVIPVQHVHGQQSAKSVANSGNTGQESVSEYPSVKLNSIDSAKNLKDFTKADTVNFTMEGNLAVHILKSDETITKLALKYYGTKKLWPYIIKYNNIEDAGKLHEGTRIMIPVLKAK